MEVGIRVHTDDPNEGHQLLVLVHMLVKSLHGWAHEPKRYEENSWYRRYDYRTMLDKALGRNPVALANAVQNYQAPADGPDLVAETVAMANEAAPELTNAPLHVAVRKAYEDSGLDRSAPGIGIDHVDTPATKALRDIATTLQSMVAVCEPSPVLQTFLAGTRGDFTAGFLADESAWRWAQLQMLVDEPGLVGLIRSGPTSKSVRDRRGLVDDPVEEIVRLAPQVPEFVDMIRGTELFDVLAEFQARTLDTSHGIGLG